MFKCLAQGYNCHESRLKPTLCGSETSELVFDTIIIGTIRFMLRTTKKVKVGCQS